MNLNPAFVPAIPIVLFVILVAGLVYLYLTSRGARASRARKRALIEAGSKWPARRRRVLIVVISFVVAGSAIWAVTYFPARLLQYWASVTNNPKFEETQNLGVAAQITLLSIGGLIALLTLALSYDRHLSELDKEDHATVRDYRARFTKISESLSSSERSRRSNALRELGILADDWHNHGRDDERRLCVEVICEFLRSPWSPEDDETGDETRVREVGFSVIAEHLRYGDRHPKSWQGLTFDLKQAIIRRADFSYIRLGQGTNLNLAGATVTSGPVVANSTGLLTMRGSAFHRTDGSGRAAANRSGYLKLSYSHLWRTNQEWSGLTLIGSTLDLTGLRMTGSHLWLYNLVANESNLIANGLQLCLSVRESYLHITRCDFTKSEVDFSSARIASGELSLRDVEFSKSSRLSLDRIAIEEAPFLRGFLRVETMRFKGSEFSWQGSDLSKQPLSLEFGIDDDPKNGISMPTWSDASAPVGKWWSRRERGASLSSLLLKSGSSLLLAKTIVPKDSLRLLRGNVTE